MGGGASALSNDGGGSWASNRDITISNPGAALSDYQILVNLTGAAFPSGAKADGADVRFTNSAGKELAFWIEEWNSSAQKAKVWVNVTSIPAGASAVRMWWGNPGAGSASDGDTTFLLFDDFNDAILDSSKWHILFNTILEANGYLRLFDSYWGEDAGSNTVETISNFGDVAINYDGYAESSELPSVTARGTGTYEQWNGYDSEVYSGVWWVPTDMYLRIGYRLNKNWVQNGGYDQYGTPFAYNLNTWYKREFTIYNDQVVAKVSTMDNSRSTSLSYSATGLPDNGKIAFGTWGDAGRMDNLRVRKFASPEPTVRVGPIAEYHFDGDAKDSSGNGNDGTINGGAAFVDGVRGKALSFDGVNDYVKINKDDSWQSQDLTIELWIKPITQSNLAAIIGCHGEGTPALRGWIIQTYPTVNGTIFGYGNGIAWLGPDGFNLIANAWQHLSVTKSGNSIKIYLNGKVLESYTTTDATILYGTGSARPDLYIGNWFGHSYWDRSLKGLIDEVRIYNRALSATEIKAEYDKLAPPTLTEIFVSPSPATITVGSAQPFTATDQGGNPISVDWSSSDPTVGTVSPATGTSTNFTALKAGAATVRAASGEVSGSASVEVITHRIAYLPITYHNDQQSHVDFQVLKDRAEKVKDYYEQQSYGNENIGFEFIGKDCINCWTELDKAFSEFDSPGSNSNSDKYYEAWDKIRDYAINYVGITDVNKYDAIVVIQPEYLRAYSDGKKIVLSSEHYPFSTWTHELGHSIFGFNDYYMNNLKEAVFNSGDVGYWGLMGSGDHMNPPAPIMSHNKLEKGWLKLNTISSESYNKYQVKLLSQMQSGDYVNKYFTKIPLRTYLFEGRFPPDDIDYDTTDSDLTSYRWYICSNIVQDCTYPTEGIQLYLDVLGNVFAIPNKEDNKKTITVTLPPDESYKDDCAEVKFTAKKENSQLYVDIEPHKPIKKKTLCVLSIQSQISGSIQQTALNSHMHEDIDLHAYTYDGRHIGMNYTTMEYENQILNSGTSGNIPGGGPEWISTPEDIDSYFVIDATPARKWAEENNVILENVAATWQIVNYDENGLRTESEPIISNVSLNDITILDNIAPTTSISIAEIPGTNNWFTSNVHINLTASDEGGSGVDTTEYNTDGVNWIPYTGTPFTISTEGATTISYRSTDNAGNVEETKTKIISIDKTKPVITISGVTDASYYNGDVTPVITITDINLDTQSTTLNGASYTSSTAIPAEGSYTLVASAADKAGNNASQTVSFVIDKTSPEAAIKFDATSKDIKVYDSETGTEAGYIVLPSKKETKEKKDDGESDDGESDDDDEKGWELRQYTLNDHATNSLVLVLKHKNEGKEAQVHLVSTRYKGGAVIKAVKNTIHAQYSEEKSGAIKELEQELNAKELFNAEAKYSAKKGISEIKVKLEGKKEKKETRAGIVILELLTDKGGLKLRY